MNRKVVLRLISLLMFVAAVVFVIIAVSCPTLGRVFYIGSFRVDGDVLHIVYNIYLIIMVLLFLLSFIGKKKNLGEIRYANLKVFIAMGCINEANGLAATW